MHFKQMIIEFGCVLGRDLWRLQLCQWMLMLIVVRQQQQQQQLQCVSQRETSGQKEEVDVAAVGIANALNFAVAWRTYAIPCSHSQHIMTF